MICDPLKSLDMKSFPSSVQVLPYGEIIRMGQQSNQSNNPPNADDIAIIMFTSGSTGSFPISFGRQCNEKQSIVGMVIAVIVIER